MDTVTRYFQIHRRDLVFLKFILEAYEGLSTLSTEDRVKGIVRLNVPRPFNADVDALIEALRMEISMTEVELPEGTIVEPSPQPCKEGSYHA